MLRICVPIWGAVAGPLPGLYNTVKTRCHLLRARLSRDKALARYRVTSMSLLIPDPSMISFFRRFFKSKLGIPLTLAFLALIAIAFASSDVANTGTFGGIAGGDRVAVIGDRKIGGAELVEASNNALDRVRQQNPTATMEILLEDGGLDDVLNSLIQRFAISGYAEKYGLRAGDNLVNSEIIGIPAFQGAGGDFSEDAYRQVLQQNGLTDAQVRADIANGLLAQQIMAPAGFGAKVPAALARQYAQLSTERRQGAIGLLTSASYAPKKDATDAQLEAYYTANRVNYLRPERRTLRYLAFGPDQITDRTDPTDAEIAARYEENAASYAAREERSGTQLIVPTESAAKSIAAKVAGGTRLSAAAQEAGLTTTPFTTATKSDLASQTSAAVADAVFAAARGKVATPARSNLGWHVMSVTGVNNVKARSLADVRSEISAELKAQNRRQAMSDLAANVEEQVDSGVALSEIAEDLEVEIKINEKVIADGRIYQSATKQIDPILQPALATAFQMEEGEPQLAEIEAGQTFIVYEASNIIGSAAAPLTEIKDRVAADWKRAEGAKAARAAADRILKRIAEGKTLAAALREEKVANQPPEKVNLRRADLNTQQRVPAPLALLFSMAEGTEKKLAAPDNLGWFLVQLDDISTQELDAGSEIVTAARNELNQVSAREYVEQLTTAMQNELGVERNAAGIEAVRKQLAGET